MDPLSPPLCTLPPGPEPPRFVCYCEGEGSGEGDRGDFNLYVTDAAELWSTCFTPDSLAALKARFGLSAAEDITPRFRAACEQQAVALTLQEDRASLTLSGGPSALAFDLSKVPGPEAAPRLQALTLGLAKRVWSLERRLAAAEETAASPRKSPRPAGPQLFLPDPDPQRGGPGPGVRRRCPGESLINPGFKRNQLAAWTLMRPEGAAQVWPRGESACEGRGSLKAPIRDPPRHHLHLPVLGQD
ncbi:protein PAXX isoform X2 [Nomascus leucogenys]|uniref:protein PAXX isoform X2 n=1 Tax=Nomascus leucogenys TaxID=61853 RepID=UPI00122D5669|nr:protein PAXX isoform X2 [Nomascus leucogenys]